eukprot:3182196-Rhodomonas_salina.1
MGEREKGRGQEGKGRRERRGEIAHCVNAADELEEAPFRHCQLGAPEEINALCQFDLESRRPCQGEPQTMSGRAADH